MKTAYKILILLTTFAVACFIASLPLVTN